MPNEPKECIFSECTNQLRGNYACNLYQGRGCEPNRCNSLKPITDYHAVEYMGDNVVKIADCAKTHGFDKIKFVDSMEEAVSYIAGKAQDGEAVLLSPACASWGMFPNYEVRGDIFKDCVRKLKEN